MANIYPVITLYQPWATWIIRGWKTIETRTHNKFASLAGKRILIHAGLTTDAEAIKNPYLTKEQLLLNPDEVVNGFILGSAFVKLSRPLEGFHSKPSLIDCGTVKRFGLFLTDVERLNEPIKESGEVGIWYYDLEAKKKVKKPILKTNYSLF